MWRPAAQNAIDLAVFRIIVCLVVLVSADFHTAANFANLPNELRHGVAALLTPNLAQLLHTLAVFSLSLCLIGLFSRTSALISLISLTLLLSLPIAAGAFRHYHHLVWFMAVLAATPCGDALSIDRLLAVRRGKMPVILPPAPACGFALDVIWLLVGALYFFPGLWKVLSTGAHWPEVMLQNMYWKWAQFNRIPSFRLDLHPLLLQLSAWSVIVFELAILPLQFVRKLRPWLILAMLSFHWGAGTFMYLSFVSLWLCYAGLFNWTPALEPLQTWVLQKLLRSNALPPVPARPLRPIALLCAPLLAGVLWAGITRDVFAWPFACYPTFDVAVGQWMPRLDLFAVDAQGKSQRIPMLTGLDGQQDWGLQWRLLQQPQTLKSWLVERAKRNLPQNTVELQAWRVLQSTVPGRWAQTRGARLVKGVRYEHLSL